MFRFAKYGSPDNMNALMDAASEIGIRATFCRFTTAEDNWTELKGLLKEWRSKKSDFSNVWIGVDIPRILVTIVTLSFIDASSEKVKILVLAWYTISARVRRRCIYGE